MGVDLVCVTLVGGGVEILGQQRVLEWDMNACHSSRPWRHQAGGRDDMRWWVDGRLKESFPWKRGRQSVEGWRPEAGVHGEGQRRAQAEEDYAAAAVEGDVGGQRARRGQVRPSKTRCTAGGEQRGKSHRGGRPTAN
jgi:hypothetical protein